MGECLRSIGAPWSCFPDATPQFWTNGWFNHAVLSCASKGLFDWWRIGGQIIVANWPSMGAPWSWDWWQFNLSTMRMDCHVRPNTSTFWSVECISQLFFTDFKADLKLFKEIIRLNTEPVYENLVLPANIFLKKMMKTIWHQAGQEPSKSC